MTGVNPYEEKARQRKVTVIVAAFDVTIHEAGEDCFAVASIEKAIEKMRAATPAQWVDLAARLGLKNPPSDTTVAAVIAFYEERLALVNASFERGRKTDAQIDRDMHDADAGRGWDE